MSMTLEEKRDQPHAVYWIYNRKMELLYVGCSCRLFSRLRRRDLTAPWRYEIAAVKVVWYPNRVEGMRVEAAEILVKAPKYNKRVTPVDNVMMNSMRPPRGHCPKCGKPKQRPAAAYCNSCYNAYAYQRRMERQRMRSELPPR